MSYDTDIGMEPTLTALDKPSGTLKLDEILGRAADLLGS
jgi:hypothetical protein